MTEGEEQPAPVADRKAERRCFHWMFGFSAGLCLLVVGGRCLMSGLSGHLKASHATPGRMTADHLGPFFLANAILSILMVVFGFGLKFSLIKWPLAIRARRKMMVGTGFLPGEHR
jgi:hypothetical protein